MESTAGLLDRKRLLMNEVMEQLDSWDNTAEGAVSILAGNETCFIRMKEIDQKLSHESIEQLKIETQNEWNEILVKQQELLSHIQHEKLKIQNQMEQVGKKKKVVNNYMAMKKSSLFVDRDV